VKKTGELRPAVLADASGIAEIYNYYITHTAITFEEETLTAEAAEDRIRELSPQYPWYVWEEGGIIAGYAYAHAWHHREAYRYAAEDSVYLKPGWERRGIGRRLLEKVIGELQKQEFHVLMAAITVPNAASVGLHEGLGFKKAGQFNEIGFKLGKRLDVGYWELMLAGPALEGSSGGSRIAASALEGGAGVDRQADPEVRPADSGGRGEASPPKKGIR
jgi:phosphinothricin acetyltransferase